LRISLCCANGNPNSFILPKRVKNHYFCAFWPTPLNELFRSATAVGLPSVYEPFGISLLE
jgi:hypothetical protein